MSSSHDHVTAGPGFAIDDVPLPEGVDSWDWGGFLSRFSHYFSAGAGNLYGHMDDLMKKLTLEPDNPEVLAEFQAAMGAYQAYTGLQSNATKTFKDVGQNTLANMR
jgi:type III secretion protein F